MKHNYNCPMTENVRVLSSYMTMQQATVKGTGENEPTKEVTPGFGGH